MTFVFIDLAVLPNENSSCASVIMMGAADMRNSHDLSLANSHFKQPPEVEIARDGIFPSGSYGVQ